MMLLLADVVEFTIMLSIKKLSGILPPFSLDSLSWAAFGGVVGTLVHSPYFWLGVTGIVMSFIVWMTVLSSIDLSIAFPLGSLSFIVIPILSIFFLNEVIPLMRWLGIVFIIVGIITLSWNEKEKGGNSA